MTHQLLLTSGETVEVTVPAMGEVLPRQHQLDKQPGDAVSKDETLVEIETDKVAVEVDLR